MRLHEGRRIARRLENPTERAQSKGVDSPPWPPSQPDPDVAPALLSGPCANQRHRLPRFPVYLARAWPTTILFCALLHTQVVVLPPGPLHLPVRPHSRAAAPARRDRTMPSVARSALVRSPPRPTQPPSHLFGPQNTTPTVPPSIRFRPGALDVHRPGDDGLQLSSPHRARG